MPSSSATRSRRPISNPIANTARTCSTATSPMPTPGSRSRTSRIPTPARCSTAKILDAELSKIEKPAGIANPKDFRNEVVKFALRTRASNDGKNPAWTSYEKLREVIEKRMFSQVEDLLPVISFGSKKDSKTEKQHAEFVQRMKSSAATPSVRCAGWSSGTCGSTRRDEGELLARGPDMPHFIDRRLNPKDKSLGNRQRFLRRARAQIKEAVDESINEPQDRATLATAARSRSRPRASREPRFRHRLHRRRPRSACCPATRSSCPAIRSPKPPGRRRRGPRQGSAGQGDGEDDFIFVAVARGIPRHLLRGSGAARPDQDQPEGHQGVQAAPGRLHLERHADQSQCAAHHAQQLSAAVWRLRRPSRADRNGDGGSSRRSRRKPRASTTRACCCSLRHCALELQQLERRQRTFPIIDPIDLRYKRFEPSPCPNAKAVMFCLMDVSGSMGEREKDLAKRFFILLHLFLKRRYEQSRHRLHPPHSSRPRKSTSRPSSTARETGGTVVSTALEEMQKVIEGTLSARGVEHLRGPGVRRRQFHRRHRALRLSILHERPTAAVPVLRLCRDPRRERVPSMFSNPNNGKDALARLPDAARQRWQNFSMKHIAKPFRHLSGVPRAVLQAGERRRLERRPMTVKVQMNAAKARNQAAVRGLGLEFPHHAADLRRDPARSRSTIWGSTSIPTRSRSSRPSRCSTPIRSIGMPLMYQHWSFGKRFVHRGEDVPQGPSWVSPTRSSSIRTRASATTWKRTPWPMQTLVLAHAAFGHNHFFKNNYLFQQWTDADGILDYLNFAKRFIAQCEERHGLSAVEDDSRRRPCADGPGRVPLSPAIPSPICASKQARERERQAYHGAQPTTTSGAPCRKGKTPEPIRRVGRRVDRSARSGSSCRRRTCSTSSRRYSPVLEPWQRELLRIVRNSRNISIRSARPR